jgi:ribosomal protein L11 methyltransferase
VTGRVVRLGIRVRAEQAETALANLLPLLGDGAEERDLDGQVEYAIYLPEGELPPAEAIRSLGGDAVLGTITEPVPEDWERRYLAHLQTVRAGAITIRPPWLEGDPGDLVIDPDTTFGAGTHESTRLSLELLQRIEPGGPLCDWGAGSGIVAIAAARLGFGPVDAVEVMPDGLEAIASNAAANGVSVRTHWLNLAATPAPWAPTVIANLTIDLLQTIAAEVLERPPERMIASGVLAADADAVGAAFARHGLHEVGRRVRAEWAAVLLAGAGERP